MNSVVHVQGSYFQPSDNTRHSIKMATHKILLDAYADNMVCVQCDDRSAAALAMACDAAAGPPCLLC